jgi:hypothetical protein
MAPIATNTAKRPPKVNARETALSYIESVNHRFHAAICAPQSQQETEDECLSECSGYRQSSSASEDSARHVGKSSLPR